MLKPNENKRDWFLFHMTPAGMAGDQNAASGLDSSRRIALVVLAGILVVGVLLAAAAAL